MGISTYQPFLNWFFLCRISGCHSHRFTAILGIPPPPVAHLGEAYSVVVEEGETVVLPARWWHWAKSLTPSITPHEVRASGSGMGGERLANKTREYNMGVS